MKAKVSISRNSSDIITISIHDEASSIQFVEAHMTPEKFAMALTGLSLQEADMEIRGLHYVGKKRVTESRSVVCPLNTHSREELQQWLKENSQDEGWILNTYLGAQHSVSHHPEGRLLRYTVTKYVDDVSAKEEVK